MAMLCSSWDMKLRVTVDTEKTFKDSKLWVEGRGEEERVSEQGQKGNDDKNEWEGMGDKTVRYLFYLPYISVRQLKLNNFKK